MSLQNQMYQQKTQYEQFMKAGGAGQSAVDVSVSKQTDISKISKKANDHEYGGGIDDLEDEQENNQNTPNQPGSQQNPGELDDKSKKIQELLGDMIQMRKRLKKEEESKRQY